MSSVLEEGRVEPVMPSSPARAQITPYGKERPLFIISLVISLLAWTVLIVGTIGIALVWVLFGWLAFLFAHSAFIAYLKGTAVEITPQQFPELHERIRTCCARVGIKAVPRTYLFNGQGMLNALATRFLGRDFLVLYSDVVDALKPHPQSLDFYIGHELGHIQRKHLIWGPVLLPSSMLPLLGAAYSRAREYTCDAYGQACCEGPEDAARALAVLAAGPHRWATMDLAHYTAQARESGGFWMSFHELVADYPWLVKRMARVRARGENGMAALPRRHVGAWLLAIFVPRVGVGAGAGAGALLTIAMIGVLAAIAIPAFQDYQARAKGMEIFSTTHHVRDMTSDYIIEKRAFPESLADLGVTGPLPWVADVSFAGERITFELKGAPALSGKTIVYEPQVSDGRLSWSCTGGDLPAAYRIAECR